MKLLPRRKVWLITVEVDWKMLKEADKHNRTSVGGIPFEALPFVPQISQSSKFSQIFAYRQAGYSRKTKPFWTLTISETKCAILYSAQPLQWRHNKRNGVSNHRRLHC